MSITKSPTQSQAGFTLVEILLYAGIVALMTTAISGMLALSLQARVKNQVIESVESGAAIVIDDITKTIRNSESTVLTTDAQSNAIMTIDVFDAAKDPTIYQLQSGVMTKKEGASAAIQISSSNIRLDDFIATDQTPAGELAQVISFSFLAQYNGDSTRQEFQYDADFTAAAQATTP